MSVDHPMPPGPPGAPDHERLRLIPVWMPPLPRPKFQHRYGRHLALFLVTFVTTTWAGGLNYAGFAVSLGAPPPVSLLSWPLFLSGLWFSVPVLAILGAHEMGHYYYCRRYDVDATLPYFLPAPLPWTGTAGAVIRIREPFPSKRALFDIGVAGPIAGFVVLLPFLFAGLSMSEMVRLPEEAGGVIYFGEPLLLKAFAWVQLGPKPPGHDIVLHPMGFAAWWGLLATALNLLPFGQLDGGHLAYALFGRRSSLVSGATLGAAVALTFLSASWILFTLMMLVMAFVLGIGHPRVVDEHTPLDPRRRLVAALTLAIFVVCFTPVPIETFF